MVAVCLAVAACVHRTSPEVNPVFASQNGWSKDAGSYLFYRGAGHDVALSI